MYGLESLGVEHATAIEIVLTVALDSVPPLRRAIYLCLGASYPGGRTTREIAVDLKLPTTTVRRGLEELTVYGLTRRDKLKTNDIWFRLELP